MSKFYLRKNSNCGLIREKFFYRVIVLLAYVMFILWITLINRDIPTGTNMLAHPFWEYKAFIQNMSWITAHDIVLNIFLFIPYGFLFSNAFRKRKYLAMITGLMFSVAIEMCQLFFQLGWAEIDDIVNNSLGAIIGYKLYVIIERKLMK